MRKLGLAAFATLAVAACAVARPNEPGGDDQPGPTDGAPSGCAGVDVLMVIDDSSTMGEEHIEVAAKLGRLTAQLGAGYRIGVTTTSRDFAFDVQTPFGTTSYMQTGDNGALVRGTRCGLSQPWIDDDDASETTAACLVDVGVAGATYAMPLAALRDAVVARVADGSNAGFHRPDRLLGAIVVTDKDDCSYASSVSLAGGETLCVARVDPVSEYGPLLDSVVGGHHRWSVTAIAGPTPTACTSPLGSASPAARLAEFAGTVGGGLASICDGDLGLALEQAGQRFRTACDDWQ